MKSNLPLKRILVEIICLLYVLLFVYAAVSKLLDFENFQVQLGQSPLLSAYAGYLVWFIPSVEILIALLLSIPSYRKIGLLSGFGLMIMFTVYIYLILNYSSFIPCSCGGILEQMSWNEHFYFNLAFCLFAVVAFYLSAENKWYFLITTSSVLLISSLLMIGLFISAEEIVTKRNNFVRKFPPFPAQRDTVIDLDASNYYFAGTGDSTVYLGNPTAPALITEFESSLLKPVIYHFQIKDTLFNFLNIKLSVDPPYFFVYDGKVPCIFKGKLEKLTAVLQTEKIPGFTKAKVVDSSTFIIRTLNPFREHLLATLSVDRGTVRAAPDLLEKQFDGLFDTDGILNYSRKLQRFVYVYYYRNEYIVTDKDLHLIDRGNTIDTTTQAVIKTQYVTSKRERKFSAPPLMVNRLSAVNRNLLFVNSTLPSRYEEKKMWKNANVIDVYDVISKLYLMSFYIYKIDGEKITDMVVTDTHLYAIIGAKLVVYRLNKTLTKHFN